MYSSYVYMLSNRPHGVIYIGMTSDLVKRVWQHKAKVVDGFTKTYNLTRLVWYEVHDDINSAIESEKKLKNVHRDKKIAIIEAKNPSWEDLYPELMGERSCAVASQPAG